MGSYGAPSPHTLHDSKRWRKAPTAWVGTEARAFPPAGGQDPTDPPTQPRSRITPRGGRTGLGQHLLNLPWSCSSFGACSRPRWRRDPGRAGPAPCVPGVLVLPSKPTVMWKSQMVHRNPSQHEPQIVKNTCCLVFSGRGDNFFQALTVFQGILLCF